MTVTRMSAQDALWLTMDRPNNLMVVDVAVVLAGIPSLEQVRAGFRDLVDRFPVFGRTCLAKRNSWHWADDPDFDLDSHVTAASLADHDGVPDAPGLTALQEFVAEQRTIALDRNRPLWSATLISPVRLDDGTVGSAVHARFHHAIADGVRLTQVMIGMLESADGAVVPSVSRHGVAGSGPISVSAPLTAASEVAHMASAAARATAGGLAGIIGSPRTAARSVARLPRRTVGSGIQLIRHPDQFVDALEILGMTDHRSLNDVTAVAKLLLIGADQVEGSGTPGLTKAVAWSPPMPLRDIKAIARATGATVNDVLIAALAGALRRYLTARADALEEIAWMVPVNLTPFDEALPPDLGNHFALVMLAMPLHHDDRAERIAEVHHRMERIKHSDEPVITFGLQRVMAMAPDAVTTFLTNFFANKSIGILTNVPGPTAELAFAGFPVHQVIGFAPCTGNQQVTATIFTYNGTVTVGFATDAALVPDPGTLVSHVRDEITALLHDLVTDE